MLDADTLDDEVDNTRSELRSAVDALRQLEGQPELSGFSLNPVSQRDLQVIADML